MKAFSSFSTKLRQDKRKEICRELYITTTNYKHQYVKLKHLFIDKISRAFLT